MSRLAFPFRRRGSPGRALPLAVALLAVLGQGMARAGEACTATSPRTTAPVVELYTSEGCNSCPPADRWLSKLKADPTVVALAFHVDYWDRLGWKDRFASAAFTQRQAAQQATNGARFSYTPQVVVDGRDRTDWRGGGAGRGVTAGGAGRRDAGARRRPLHRQRRPGRERAEAARRRTGPSPSRATSARSRRARTRARRCITISSSATTSRCANGPRAAAPPRRCASSRRRRSTPRIRATSTWWSSTPRPAARCRP